MKVKLDKGAIMPLKAHKTDAGYDLYSTIDTILWGGQCITIDTGVHIALPENTVGFVKSKSGLMVNHEILTDGTIDCGYTGSIRVKLFNHSSRGYDIHKGDKIAQLVICPIISEDLELADELEETDRGDNGFGSSGR